MKVKTDAITINNVEIKIITDSDYINTFRVNGNIWNGFKNMSDFRSVLIDSLTLEGINNPECVADKFEPRLIAVLERL